MSRSFSWDLLDYCHFGNGLKAALYSGMQQTTPAPMEKRKGLLNSEDWVTVWLALAGIVLILAGFRPQMPALRWSDSPGIVLSGANIFRAAVLCAECLLFGGILFSVPELQ